MKKISIPYGKGVEEAFVPDEIHVQYIEYDNKIEKSKEMELLLRALDNPIGTKPVEELVAKDDNVLIVVNDHTRPSPDKIMISELLKRLHKKVSKAQIKFIIATGTHRNSTEEELKTRLGENVVRDYKIIMHNCKDMSRLKYYGTIDNYNMPIYLNKALSECTFCILTGLISPHQSAGYSGGRKSILPGLAGLETLKIHHSLPIRPFEPAMGKITDNPFHEIALYASKLVKVDFILNAVQDPLKQNIDFVAGDMEKAHKSGVKKSKDACEIKVDSKSDIIVISPGGFPRDIDLYQSQKAISVGEVVANAACQFILVAECKDGYGSDLMIKWLKEASSPNEVIDRFKTEGYDVGTSKAFLLARALLKGKVTIVSEYLKKEDLKEMMLHHSNSLQDALDEAIKNKTPNNISVVPYAVNMVPILA
jgi:nickel-dependent lactate racemase